MLGLSRKARDGEDTLIFIDERTGERLVDLRIVRVNGNKVSVGIDAPRHIKVIRGELELPPLGPVPNATPPIISGSGAVA